MSEHTFYTSKQEVDLLFDSVARGRVSHAYIFAGINDSLKAALELAKAVNCLSRKGRPCGNCSICRRIETGNHPDVKFYSAEGSMIKINQMRAMQADAHIRPFETGSKVYIINDAHKMTDEAANCILKLLEEPPEFCIFILLTTALQKILPTIVSRCQVVEFKQVQEADRDLSDELYNRREEIIRLLDSFADGKTEALTEGETIYDSGRETAALYLKITISLLRDMLIYSMTKDLTLISNTGEEGFIKEHAGCIPAKHIIELLQAFDTGYNDLGKNANTSLLATALLLKIWRVYRGNVYSSRRKI
jgi:DNA polymerase III delta' subunit